MKKLMLLSMLFLSLALAVTSTDVSATTLLINQQSPYLGYGYGMYDWDNMTGAINTSFGGSGNVTVSSTPLTNLSYMLGFDRLWITASQPGSSLTAAEIANIQSYIATGRRVVLIGENDGWTVWNTSILQTVGGSYNGLEINGTLTPVVINDLTAGITSLDTFTDGIATGGTSLFSQNVATLWGLNAVSLLSVNVIDDDGISAGNIQFETNLANWLAGSGGVQVPEPMTLLLLGFGLAGLAGARRLKK